MLAVAIKFAAECHQNQVDKGGTPYILHPLTVMSYLETDDLELMCIAVLHDVIEDCHVTGIQLRQLGMSERVVAGVVALTRKNKETHTEKMNRLTSNIDAVRVKLCDLRHNCDIRRLKTTLTEKDVARLKVYHRMQIELTEVLSKHKYTE